MFCLSFSGCGGAEKPPEQSSTTTPDTTETPAVTTTPTATDPPSETEVSSVQLGNFEIVSSLKNSFEYEYSEFNLGGRSYTTPNGREMPYDIRGTIAVPEGDGPFPLVLIAHGAHEEEDETKRFDTGFDYLVRALAQNGYVAVSLDMLKPYIQRYGGNDDYVEKMLVIADDHIQGLHAANGGEALYPVGLTGKIDFENVALLGHSRSGSAVFQIAKEHTANGIGIGAVLSLAPSADFWVEFGDMPIAFLVPQYDGDVIQLDGIYMFDFLAGRVAGEHSVTLLMGANHNFFNRNIERDDSAARGMQNAYPPLTRAEQEDFLVNFAVDFFDASLGGADNFFHTSKPQPNKMYGYDVNRQLRLGEPVDLIDAMSTNGFSSDTSAVTSVVDSVFFNEDGVLINTVTTSILDTILDGTRDKNAETLNYVSVPRSLISVEWTQPDSAVTILPNTSDFSGKNTLTIQIIPDSASELNNPEQALNFTIALRDADGNTAMVKTAEEQNALRCYPGELRSLDLTDDFKIEYWEPATPLGMLSIPLSLFEAVNLSSIEAIDLVFDHGESGAVYIASIQLQ